MKRALFITICSAAFSCASLAVPGDERVLYDLSPTDLHDIARRLRIRFTERGMGCFDLGSGRRSIFAALPSGPCEPVPRSDRPPESTLSLSYSSSQRRVSLAAVNSWNRAFGRQVSTATLSEDAASLGSVLVVEQGVTFRTALDHVRRFIREIDGFEKHLKKQR